jgi:predicted Rossmann fold nucleotide-binding protein DprA/Smf involved in DNA uptake
MSSLDTLNLENLHLAALNSIPGLGPKRLTSLYNKSQSWRAAWQANPKLWQSIKIPNASQIYWQKQQKNFNFSIFLVQEIIKQGGLILSEYSPNASPIKSNFILRNCLLAAFSPITLVIEANLKSGSMTTARFDQKMKRSLYTVPGNIFNNQASGCHKLIQEGAKLCSNYMNICGNEEVPNIPTINNLSVLDTAA